MTTLALEKSSWFLVIFPDKGNRLNTSERTPLKQHA